MALLQNSLVSVSELRVLNQLTAGLLHEQASLAHEIVQPMTLRLIFYYLSVGRLQFVLRPLERRELWLDYSPQEIRCMLFLYTILSTQHTIICTP